MPEPTAAEVRDADLQAVLDEELSRLPDHYRGVLVLCDLEGMTRREAARQLGCPEGTVASRLARARTMLAKRLTQRGVALSGGVLAAVLSEQAASAGVPNSVVVSTIKAASLLAAGKAAAAGAISLKVAALTEGVLKAMSMTKFKTAFVLIVVVCVLGWGGGVAVWQTQAKAHLYMPLVELPVDKPMPDLSGTWQGDEWGTVVLRPTKKGEFDGTYTDTFGKDVGRIAVRWSTASSRYEGTWSEGTFRFGRIALEAAKDGKAISGAYTTDPKCEHQPGVPSLASLRWSRANPEPTPKTGKNDAPALEKEAFTAWGKEIGGLQAGFGFLPGQRRAYHHGETVTLVVRVRNVSKEEVKFQYLRQFIMEKAPTVTDGKGKPVDFRYGWLDTAIVHIPVDINLAPGKEIVLGEVELLTRLLGTGKFGVEYERVFGNSTMGTIRLDPILSKLSTGKMELEIKSDPPPAATEKK